MPPPLVIQPHDTEHVLPKLELRLCNYVGKYYRYHNLKNLINTSVLTPAALAFLSMGSEGVPSKDRTYSDISGLPSVTTDIDDDVILAGLVES